MVLQHGAICIECSVTVEERIFEIEQQSSFKSENIKSAWVQLLPLQLHDFMTASKWKNQAEKINDELAKWVKILKAESQNNRSACW